MNARQQTPVVAVLHRILTTETKAEMEKQREAWWRFCAETGVNWHGGVAAARVSSARERDEEALST